MAANQIVKELARLKILMLNGWHLINTKEKFRSEEIKDIALVPPCWIINHSEFYVESSKVFQASHNYASIMFMNDQDFIDLVNSY